MPVHPEGQQDDEGEAPNGQQRVGQHREQGGGCRGWLVRDFRAPSLRQVGEALVAEVAFTAAEVHLGVLLGGHALLPVVAVEVVQPAALLDELDGAGAVAPGGVAVQPLVLLALAALQATLVGALQLPVGVVVNALPSLGLPTPGTFILAVSLDIEV